LCLSLSAGSAAAGDETFVKVTDIHSRAFPLKFPALSKQYGRLRHRFVDSKTDLLLVADLSNKALDVIQASTHSFLF